MRDRQTDRQTDRETEAETEREICVCATAPCAYLPVVYRVPDCLMELSVRAPSFQRRPLLDSGRIICSIILYPGSEVHTETYLSYAAVTHRPDLRAKPRQYLTVLVCGAS